MNIVTAPMTGLDVIRAKVDAMLKGDPSRNRIKGERFSKSMLDELGLSLRDLEDFVDGIDLKPSQADAIARLLLDATLDAAGNLRPLKPREVTSAGVPPPPYVFTAGIYPPPAAGWQDVPLYPRQPDAENKPAWDARPGWA
jgi:hypothetical protein